MVVQVVWLVEGRARENVENVAVQLVPVQRVNLVSTVSQQAVTASSGFPRAAPTCDQ